MKKEIENWSIDIDWSVDIDWSINTDWNENINSDKTKKRPKATEKQPTIVKKKECL